MKQLENLYNKICAWITIILVIAGCALFAWFMITDPKNKIPTYNKPGDTIKITPGTHEVLNLINIDSIEYPDESLIDHSHINEQYWDSIRTLHQNGDVGYIYSGNWSHDTLSYPNFSNYSRIGDTIPYAYFSTDTALMLIHKGYIASYWTYDTLKHSNK